MAPSLKIDDVSIEEEKVSELALPNQPDSQDIRIKNISKSKDLSSLEKQDRQLKDT